MPWQPKSDCCSKKSSGTTTTYTLNTLATFGREYANPFSPSALPEKEEYTTYADVKTTSPHTQHYNKNFANTPLDYDTKIIVRYTADTKKIQNDWYVIINNTQLRVKSMANINLQNDYLALYCKTEKHTV
jgi:hypothetical protein